MRLGSKHQSEASFSFQINDAVKGDEEYLLAEDDFLRDANDYTITTPAPPSRTRTLERDQQVTRGQMASRTDDHDVDADASLTPSLFTPSSPTRANVHHREAAATKGLNAPRPSIPILRKPSTPKMMSGTHPMIKWPPPSREIGLPCPDASPVISTLANLREETTMLTESDGVYPASVDEQQEADTSDKRAGSSNKSLLDSNMPPATRIQNPTEIRAGALMNKGDRPTVSRSATQSTSTHEPPLILSSTSLSDDENTSEPVSAIARTDTMSEPVAICNQNVIKPVNPVWCLPMEDSDRGNGVESRRAASIGGNDQVDDPMAPLTISQLSPRKLLGGQDQGLASNSSITTPMSPMRPPRKRPSSTVTSNHEDERNKKGKTVPRTTRNHVTTAKASSARNPRRPTRRKNTPADADRGNQGTTMRQLVSSGSSSRLRSSQLSSSGAAVASASSSSRAQIQSKGTNERDRVQVKEHSQKRAADARRDIGNSGVEICHNNTSLTNQNDVLASASSMATESRPEMAHETTTASTSRPTSPSTDSNGHDNHARQGSQPGPRNHANTERSLDFRFKFRSEARGQSRHVDSQVTSAHRQSRSRSQHQLRSSGSLKTSNAAATSASCSSSSNLRSVGSMTRSQFRYTHHRPIPDYKVQHALLHSSLAQRKENIAPVVPLPFEMHTDVRAKERERFDVMVKEKEKEMEREREVKRKEVEEQEERELKELRRKAIPKANTVPEWYKDAPRRKRRGEQAQGSER